MPIYEYMAASQNSSCDYCKQVFELVRKMTDAPLTNCPKCNAPVRKNYMVPSVGRGEGNFNDRAKQAGFHKLKRLGKGEYEKQF